MWTRVINDHFLSFAFIKLGCLILRTEQPFFLLFFCERVSCIFFYLTSSRVSFVSTPNYHNLLCRLLRRLQFRLYNSFVYLVLYLFYRSIYVVHFKYASNVNASTRTLSTAESTSLKTLNPQRTITYSYVII